jgi:hypothetical protein
MNNLPLGPALLPWAWLLLALNSFSQSPWEGVFMPGVQHGSERRLYADEANGTVYATGLIRFDNTTSQHSAVLAWRNNQWDTVLYDVGFIRHAVVFHDTLFIAGGSITTINGAPMDNMAYLHNGEWHSLRVNPSDPPVERFRIIDDTLYVCVLGGFGPIYRLVGGTWEPFGTAEQGVWGLDIINYQGEFYAALNGAGFVLAKLVNGSWVNLSDSLMANISMAGSLVEYQGDLYVGGQLSMNEGMPGQGIFRYDGEAFHALGSGLQTYLTNNNGWCGVQDMVVQNGLLFLSTPCNYAGGVPVNGMAIWDGTEWCSMPGDPQETGSISSIAFLSDTLYIKCGATIDGEPVGGMARFVGPVLTEECALVTEVPEHITSTELTISTTTDHRVLITGLDDGQHPYALYDAQGRLVAQGVVRATAGQARIALPDVVPALYVLRIADHAAQVLQLPNR